MADYNYKDGEKMKYNVLIPKEESVLDTYPDLDAIFGDMKDKLIVGGMTPDQVIRYVALVYDPRSPLVDREENLLHRKKRAMLILGMPTDTKGYFTAQINSVIANLNLNVIDVKMRFFRFMNNLVWMQLCNTIELFFENQRIIGQGIDNEGKKSADEIMKVRLSTQKDSEMLETKLEKLSSQLFVGDVDLLNYVGSTIIKAEIAARLTPESRVK